MRVAIVNDLALARELLRRLVLSVPGCEMAWTAADGQEAVFRAVGDPPDVILMDLIMPVLDGVEATRQIMSRAPCSILVTTSNMTGRFDLVVQAMSIGAVGAFPTPEVGPDCQIRGAEELLARLLRLVEAHGALACQGACVTAGRPDLPLVVVGASTGGPEAVCEVLGGLPAGLRAGVVVIQHIAADFAPHLVHWLNKRTDLPVRLAKEGDEPKAGAVLVAGTNDHLYLRADYKLGYTHEPSDYPYRPSVDVFFRSLSLWPRPGVAVLLTGMGCDGAQGLAELRQAGWQTIAQDQATCVVYGMPRVAAELNAACQVLPVKQIAPAVLAGLSRSTACSWTER